VPDEAKECQQNGGSPAECLDPANYTDAIMALDMDTGAVRWSTGVQGFDDWNVACIPGLPNPNACPQHPGPDFDFGLGPNLFTVNIGTDKRKVIGAGQKSGQYWLLDAATGEILWSAPSAPGSTLGGIEWGTATDGKRIYVAETNYFRIPYQLPSGQTIRSGSFAALDHRSRRLAGRRSARNGRSVARRRSRSYDHRERRRLRRVDDGARVRARRQQGDGALAVPGRRRVERGPGHHRRHDLLGQRLRPPRHPRGKSVHELLRLLAERALNDHL